MALQQTFPVLLACTWANWERYGTQLADVAGDFEFTCQLLSSLPEHFYVNCV